MAIQYVPILGPASKGMYSAGDASEVPDGYAVLLQNIFPRPGRYEFRPPFVDDSLPGTPASDCSALMVWEDIQNQQTRFIGMVGTSLYVKAASGETWGAGLSGVSGTRLLDYANYRGKLYFMMDDGSGNASAANSFDGTNVSSSPFNSTIVGRCLEAFNDRLYIAGPRVTVSALGTAITNSYDWSSANWIASNVAVSFATLNGSNKVCRLTPTSTTASACSIVYNPTGSGLISVVASTSEQKYVWRGDFRGVDPVYRLPFTMEWVLISDRANLTAYAVGDIIVIAASDSNKYRYRCTTAGTSAAAAPTFAPTGTTTDGGVTWTAEGSNILNANEDRFYTADKGWVTFSVDCSVPIRTNTVYISPRLKFYNSVTNAASTLAPVDISLKDGIADGDVRKQNYGQQWTAGDYRYPFFNKELTSTNTSNLETLVWSEIADPKRIRAVNYYEPKEAAGIPTSLIAVGGRLYLFKRRAFWTFVGQANPDIPIIAFGAVRLGVGCLHPQAMDVLDTTLFWVGENEVYMMPLGGAPMPICGAAMREEIMAKGTTWVENVSTPGAASYPILAVDAKNREIWVYTQSNALYCYHADLGAWSKHTLIPQGITLSYNPTTQRMYYAISGHGLARCDETQSTLDAVGAVTHTITVKPLQLRTPEYEVILDHVRVYLKTTQPAGGLGLRVNYSFDQGSTVAHYWDGLFQTGFQGNEYAPARFPAFYSGRSVTVSLTDGSSSNGVTGPSVCKFSKIDAGLTVTKGSLATVAQFGTGTGA